MIQAYINGFALRKTKDGAFSVLMTDGDQELERTYRVRDTTANQAELRACQFVCMAVPPGAEIELHTSSHYLATILERGEDGAWLKSPKANEEIIETIRKIIEKLRVKVVKGDTEGVQRLKDLNKAARG